MNTGSFTATFDCTSLTTVTNMTTTETLPTDTAISGIVQIDNIWYKPSTMTEIATQTPTDASVLSEGDSMATILAISGLPTFVGKVVTIKIAMSSDDAGTIMPSLSLPISVVGKAGVDTFVKIEESEEQILSTTGEVTINSIAANSTVSNGGSVSVLVSLYQIDTWSAYKTLADCVGQLTTKIKYQVTYTATTIGVSSAKLDSCVVTYQE